MARVLFVTWDGGGNVTPAVEIAGELHRRGDEVRFLGQRQQRESIEKVGFGFSAYSDPGPWTATGKRNTIMNAFGFLRLLAGRSLGRDLIAEVGVYPADIVVIDCLLWGALEAASRHGVRHIVFVHSLFAAVEQKMASGAPGTVARISGLDPWKLWTNADGIVAATLEELDIPPSKPLAISYTGPVLPSGEKLPPSKPTSATILVSLSTTYIAGQTAVLQTILDAVADLPLRAIVTTGPAVDPKDLISPANVEIHRYIPHAEIMGGVSLVVGHGGHSTTMLALAHNVPLVILPMNSAFDQPLIGRRIQEKGAGVTLAASSSATEIAAAILNVLGDKAYQREAALLGASILAATGTHTAADRVHSFLN